MKNKILLAVIPGILCMFSLNSCVSSKSMRKMILEDNTHLYYVTTTPQYVGEIKNDIYLNFIDYSNMDYYTSVKKKGAALVPLLLYNYDHSKFEARLGERSLTMNYREFITDALLTECNISTCFNLVNNTDSIACETDFVLDIRILKNITKSRMTIRNHSVFTGFIDLLLGNEDDDMSFGPYIVLNQNKSHPAITELSVKAILSKNQEIITEKEYHIKRSYPYSKRRAEDTYMLNRTCLHSMAESLSLATKELVEEISQELHLIMLSLQN